MSDSLKELIKNARDDVNISNGTNDIIKRKFTTQSKLFNETDPDFAKWDKKWFSEMEEDSGFYKSLKQNINKNKQVNV